MTLRKRSVCEYSIGPVPAQPENFGYRVHRVSNKSGDSENAARSECALTPIRFGSGAVINIQYRWTNGLSLCVHRNESFAMRTEAESLHRIVC